MCTRLATVKPFSLEGSAGFIFRGLFPPPGRSSNVPCAAGSKGDDQYLALRLHLEVSQGCLTNFCSHCAVNSYEV